MSFHGGILLLQLMIMQLGIGLALATNDQLAIAKPGCRDNKCGNLSIPYPFGMTKECYLNKNFLITCNKSTNPPKPYLRESNIEVKDISLPQGQLQILKIIARDCYTQNGSAREDNHNFPSLKLLGASKIFTISDNQNKFIAVGCDTYAIVRGEKDDKNYTTGCMSFCDKMEYANGSCSAGAGCCEISIPKGLKKFRMALRSYDNHTAVWGFNPCSYAFVVDEKEFHFSASFMHKLNNTKKLPMVLDWVISNETCKVAQMNKTSFACKGKSTCYEPDSKIGYRCICSEGYQGNPYLNASCQDINECEDSSHECEKPSHCVNTVGNYTCPCPENYHGDGRKGGDGCIKNRLPVIEVALGIGVGFIALIVSGSWLYWGLKKRRLIKLKEKFFQQNGGLLLQQELSRRQGHNETAKIFTAEELKMATNNYDETKIIGRGGYGTVYKGLLTDDKVIAIKKSKIVDQSQLEQFINEVVVLSQINHRNVVKLLGCYLETEVPLLVYEFVSNGTLFEHIHNKTKASAVSWEIRLRIAAETAGVLSYLHSAASTPIIHRDIKPTNILLDENYTAKVSDFGASRLAPIDQTELSTLVQGTLGYIDPEYFQTSQMTEKSDVYSFGVVLVELLTGKKALSFDRPEEERSLSMYFLSSLKEDRVFQILDDFIVNEGNTEQLKEVANVAEKCLRLKGEERPTMKEVAMELEGLRMMEKHPWIGISEETEYLLGEPSHNFDHTSGSSGYNTTAGYDSMRNHVILPISDAR